MAQPVRACDISAPARTPVRSALLPSMTLSRVRATRFFVVPGAMTKVRRAHPTCSYASSAPLREHATVKHDVEMTADVNLPGRR